MTRIVQLGRGDTRCVALVEEPFLRLLTGINTVYDLALKVTQTGSALSQMVRQQAGSETLRYDEVYSRQSPWRLLIPIDHPDPGHCMVTGTGLTHLGSAKDRNSMHAATVVETDSMRMFRWGVEGGKPADGKPGIAPEWFFKGLGTILRGPYEPLSVPPYGEDGGEEAEVAGIYLIGSDGTPWRIGMAQGNEFSDHKFEKRNYLNLAGSKIRECSIGPELVIGPEFRSVPGKVRIERGNTVVWQKEIATGEDEMCHSLANLEHHHFKFAIHRQPGDLHVHYYGAHSLSFGAGVEVQNGDVMAVEFTGFGRALRNPLRVEAGTHTPVAIRSLG